MATCSRLFVLSLAMLAVGSAASATDVTGPLTFVGVTPCRIIETRTSQGFAGANGPPSLVANTPRTFQITGTVTGLPLQCGIPSTAVAVSLNFTVTNFVGQGDLRVFPAGGSVPLASILNYQLENIANATTVPLGPSGGGERGIAVQADASATDFIADVNGYYVPRPFTTLEKGQTLRGQYFVSGTAAAAGHSFASALSFQVPLSGITMAPTANFIAVGAPATTNCPGAFDNPQAAPGHFCAYEVSSLRSAFSSFVNAETNASGQAGAFGTSIWITSTLTGDVWSYGTWAVTAP